MLRKFLSSRWHEIDALDRRDSSIGASISLSRSCLIVTPVLLLIEFLINKNNYERKRIRDWFRNRKRVADDSRNRAVSRDLPRRISRKLYAVRRNTVGRDE